jgi:Tfp pilus assembly PilM family ATPase
VALVDIGATMPCRSAMSNRKLIYTREQPFGCRQLTEAIMQHYGLQYQQAGLAKKQGRLPDNYVTDVLEPFRQTVAQETSRFLRSSTLQASIRTWTRSFLWALRAPTWPRRGHRAAEGHCHHYRQSPSAACRWPYA